MKNKRVAECLCGVSVMPLGRDNGPTLFHRRRRRSLPAAHQSTPLHSTTTSHPTTRTGSQPGNSMISPRTSTYDRLEGGLWTSRLGTRNVVWKRIALYLALTVGFLWLLRPAEKRVWNIKAPGELPTLCWYFCRSPRPILSCRGLLR